MIRLGTALAMCLALSGCNARKPSAPRPPTSTSASSRPAASASSAPAAPALSHAFDRGARLSAPLPITCTPDEKGGCARLTYAVFGDPGTRIVDAVWLADETTKEDVELRPVSNVPTGSRLLDAKLDGDDAVLLVESLAIGPQPAGLRALLRLDEGGRWNGPEPNGLVPPPNLATALATKLPLPWNFALTSEVQSADKEPSNAEFAALLARSVGPSGFTVEEVYQTHFRRELERVQKDHIARWPGLRSLERVLQDADNVRSGKPGLLTLSGDFEDLTLTGTDEHLVVRSLGRKPRLPARARRRDPRIVEAGGPRDRLDALLARQPVTARLVTHAPLGPRDATVGVAVVEPATAYGPLLLVEQGEARSVLTLAGLDEALYRSATRTDYRFLDADGDGITDLLVRLERPETPPWTALYYLLPPLELSMQFFGQVNPDGDVSLWIYRAETIDDAAAAALQIPRRGLRAAEAWPLVTGSRTKAGFLRSSARDAVVFSYDAQRLFEPFSGGPTFTTRATVTDADLEWLPSKPDDEHCGKFHCSNDRPRCHCEGQSGGGRHLFWFTRENGRLVLAGVARQGF